MQVPQEDIPEYVIKAQSRRVTAAGPFLAPGGRGAFAAAAALVDSAPGALILLR